MSANYGTYTKSMLAKKLINHKVVRIFAWRQPLLVLARRPTRNGEIPDGRRRRAGGAHDWGHMQWMVILIWGDGAPPTLVDATVRDGIGSWSRMGSREVRGHRGQGPLYPGVEGRGLDRRQSTDMNCQSLDGSPTHRVPQRHGDASADHIGRSRRLRHRQAISRCLNTYHFGTAAKPRAHKPQTMPIYTHGTGRQILI